MGCGIENANGTQFVYFTKNGEEVTTDELVIMNDSGYHLFLSVSRHFTRIFLVIPSLC